MNWFSGPWFDAGWLYLSLIFLFYCVGPIQTKEPPLEKPRKSQSTVQDAHTIINNDKRSAATTTRWDVDEKSRRRPLPCCVYKYIRRRCNGKETQGNRNIINPPYKNSNHLSLLNLWSPSKYSAGSPVWIGIDECGSSRSGSAKWVSLMCVIVDFRNEDKSIDDDIFTINWRPGSTRSRISRIPLFFCYTTWWNSF